MKRSMLAATAVAVLLAAAGCGGGGSDSPAVKTPAAPAAPGASVDPNSNNVITGPINQAKKVAGQQEQHDQQLQSSGGNG